jgi:hypothetical protein
MPPSKRFIEITEEMKDIHARKNAGYAGDSDDPWANFRMAEMFGVSAFQGCLVRMSDKFIRIANLSKNPNNEQVGESIVDTLEDLANYAVIAICLYEQEQEKRKEKLNAEHRGNGAGKATRTKSGSDKSISSEKSLVKNGDEYTPPKILPEWRENLGRGS